jgi:predicted transcriptional regulator
METIKTAISIQKALFKKAEDLARKMRVPRSRIYALALQDYIRRRENKNLLAQINAAHAEEPAPSEKRLRQKSKRTHRRLVEDEW